GAEAGAQPGERALFAAGRAGLRRWAEARDDAALSAVDRPELAARDHRREEVLPLVANGAAAARGAPRAGGHAGAGLGRVSRNAPGEDRDAAAHRSPRRSARRSRLPEPRLAAERAGDDRRGGPRAVDATARLAAQGGRSSSDAGARRFVEAGGGGDQE